MRGTDVARCLLFGASVDAYGVSVLWVREPPFNNSAAHVTLCACPSVPRALALLPLGGSVGGSRDVTSDRDDIRGGNECARPWLLLSVACGYKVRARGLARALGINRSSCGGNGNSGDDSGCNGRGRDASPLFGPPREICLRRKGRWIASHPPPYWCCLLTGPRLNRRWHRRHIALSPNPSLSAWTGHRSLHLLRAVNRVRAATRHTQGQSPVPVSPLRSRAQVRVRARAARPIRVFVVRHC